MSGSADRVLYVGQSANLRQRLNADHHLTPERASRRLTRPVPKVRTITWEVCANPLAAQFRENALLRLHKRAGPVTISWACQRNLRQNDQRPSKTDRLL
jgi:excinuclease UvrABC nuclease subunit